MDVLKGLIGDEWIEALKPIIEAYVEIPTVTIDAEFEITVPSPNGVEIIKEALIRARDRANEEKEIEVKFSYQGAPRYRIDITAPDYYKAEEVLEDIAEEILRVIKEAGGEATLIRKEKRIKKIKRRGA
jgi:translation initiation factor 2 subunit 1